MRYQILAIGRLKRGFAKAGCDFYAKRLEAYAKVETLELKESREGLNKERESEALLGAAGPYVVVLDERGEGIDSRGLAAKIGDLELRGVSAMSLLIGGAEGHSDALKGRADESWSLSNLTLPHELARLILLEALYRAETIRAKHPYHRD